MNILAVDTSTSLLNVTIQTKDKFVEFSEDNATSQHSETLLPVILDKCSELKIDIKELDMLVCTRGPGSFTGLRIGMSCLKGLSYGLGKPLVSVSTLTTYASMSDDFNGATVVALDAKKQRYYLAVFEVKNGNATRICADCDGNTEDIANILENYSKIRVIGPDKEAFARQMIDYYKDTKEICVSGPSCKSFGKTLIELALEQYEEKGADDIGQGPVYIRKSDAEVALEERLKQK